MLIRLGLLVAVVAATACAPAIDATIADAAVTAAVKTALLNDPTFDGTLVTVTAESGVVQLGGTQPTAEAAAAVVSVVRRVQGVQDVRSDIRIEPSPVAASTPR